jgi:SEC-C motif-containing protein
MRSRYTAFARQDAGYLSATWHPSTRPKTLTFSSKTSPRWAGLQIKKHATAGERAIVEFIASYRVVERFGRLHETSMFVREMGRWYYVNGDIHEK